jgi:hypothetical protein
MKNVTKVLLTAVTAIVAVMQSPAVQAAVIGFVAAHPNLSAVVAGISTALALIHNPSTPAAS